MGVELGWIHEVGRCTVLREGGGGRDPLGEGWGRVVDQLVVDPPTAKALVCQPLADKNAHTIHVPYLYHTFTSEPFHTNTTNLTRLIPYTYILVWYTMVLLL